MSQHKSNNKSTIYQCKKAKERKIPFLTLDLPIIDALSPYALKVYTQLRKLTDFSCEHDVTEVTVKLLSVKSGISERKIFQVLNELEHEHFLIKRLNTDHCRYGKVNSIDVSTTLGFFSDDEFTNNNFEIKQIDQEFLTPAPNAEDTARGAEGTARGAYLYRSNNSFNNSSKLTNCEGQSSSSFIFSETIDKNILDQKHELDTRTDQEFMKAVIEHVDNHSDKKYPRLKRASAVVRLLKRHKEDGIVFTVAGLEEETKTAEVTREKPQPLLSEHDSNLLSSIRSFYTFHYRVMTLERFMPNHDERKKALELYNLELEAQHAYERRLQANA